MNPTTHDIYKRPRDGKQQKEKTMTRLKPRLLSDVKAAVSDVARQGFDWTTHDGGYKQLKAARTIRQMGIKALQMILVVALVSGGTPTTTAQGTKAKLSDTSTPAKSQTGVKSRGGPQEGIKVHGHWVIEVRNPDGSLATRREFDNGLIGSIFLVQLLTRQVSTGPWIVVLSGATGTPGPCDAGGNNLACGLFEVAPVPPLSGVATATTDLTVTPFLTLPIRFELDGSVTATANSTITVVRTSITKCDASVAPATCATSSSGPVSTFTIASGIAFTPVPVVAGQIIQVKVAISFS